ncbi:hypothetical protein P43SY_011212 [Pythium insidiosum]|uniref:Uncharacterized protein n=1 Tax=Pythium insidiosum TaxID=114742 RepID=A0AAD5LS77_PYTIN|nr:hypothetical protein P43SY_011212 [Pythium insidiosum]
MAMNAQFLRQLGLQSAQQSMAQALAPSTAAPMKRKTMRRPDNETANDRLAPVRRSKRLKGIKEEGGEPQEQADAKLVEVADDDSEVETFDESSVLRYTPFEDRALLVSGGHQGQVSVYGLTTADRDADDLDGISQAPLMSFKAHSGWISCVTLALSRVGQENRLLTSGNDGVVKLWDLNQRSTASQRTGAIAKALFVADNLHRSGIFGMDVRGDEMITCSKDASIVLSSLRESAVDVVHRFQDHESVVKSVQFSPLDIERFASGGNDRVLRVFDSL